ncbi:myb/SANT-like DNA-binding domain-containing protein 4 [Saccostrea cucullata]|uniref:myb/SANT-like DNA-binding domain-containing protein 4 n=1 Tax=Saccostrea cuccullata TaxID=36930 RepID=UPI002ED433CB
MEDRKKKPRFCEKEIEILVQGVKERSDVINSKFSDMISNTKKKQAWVEIMESVNAVSFSKRTVDEIKKKWDDVKRGTKKRASAVQKERCKTGSGKLEIIPLSPMEEDIVSVMGEERIFGFSSYVDTMIPPTPSKAVSGESPPQEVQEVQTTTEGGISEIAPESAFCTKKMKRRPIQYEADESMVLQRELINIQREWLDVEKERLGIERERLQIDRRRLEMDERARGFSATCNNSERNTSEFQLFNGAFMQI